MIHSNSVKNHKIENWTYANAAARTGATGFTSADIGKLAYQTDNATYWKLTATTPTWIQAMAGPAGAPGTPGTNGQGVPTGGTAGQTLAKIDSTNYNTHWVTPSGGGGMGDLIIVREERAGDGGTFTAGAWRIRDLNTVMVDTGSHVVGLGSLGSGEVTLPAGTYRCRIRCPSNGVGPNMARLFDVTNAAVILEGSNDLSHVGTTYVSYAEIVGRFTLVANTIIRVEHQGTNTTATTGFGIATTFGDAEVYTVAEFVKE